MAIQLILTTPGLLPVVPLEVPLQQQPQELAQSDTAQTSGVQSDIQPMPVDSRGFAQLRDVSLPGILQGKTGISGLS
jgi:hypothetical protein